MDRVGPSLTAVTFGGVTVLLLNSEYGGNVTYVIFKVVFASISLGDVVVCELSCSAVMDRAEAVTKGGVSFSAEKVDLIVELLGYKVKIVSDDVRVGLVALVDASVWRVDSGRRIIVKDVGELGDEANVDGFLMYILVTSSVCGISGDAVTLLVTASLIKICGDLVRGIVCIESIFVVTNGTVVSKPKDSFAKADVFISDVSLTEDGKILVLVVLINTGDIYSVVVKFSPLDAGYSVVDTVCKVSLDSVKPGEAAVETDGEGLSAEGIFVTALDLEYREYGEKYELEGCFTLDVVWGTSFLPVVNGKIVIADGNSLVCTAVVFAL